ncbi:MAG: glutathione peroxidase [Gammaproteobacteria bacterium]|nr:glutathione peroxidase [Gammaproteobacteria bacterium]
MPQFQDFEIAGLDGSEQVLSDCANKVVLAVNVASECGYTPQYEGLQSLYRELADQGLVVIGFPCNQFGSQEPGSPEKIAAFCTNEFKVTFPLTEKIEVNGDGQHPLYAWLTDVGNGFPGDIKWNFEKFLIGRNGKPLARYPSATSPQDPDLLQDIAAALEA